MAHNALPLSFVWILSIKKAAHLNKKNIVPTWTSGKQMIFKIGFACMRIPGFSSSDAWIAY